jgi:hypothetical protein
VTHRFVKPLIVGNRPYEGTKRYRQAYEFRLERPDGTGEVVQFEIAGDQDRIRIHEGDSGTVVYSMKGESFDRIVSIVNNTTMTSFEVARAGRSERHAAIVISMVIAGVAFIVAAAPLAATFGASLAAALFAGAPSYFVLDSLISPRVKKNHPEALRAARNAEFYTQKETLLALREEHIGSSRSHSELRTRLLSLASKMRSVGDDLYASRIEQVQAGIDLLDRLIALDAATLEQYSKSITMIEIEQESLAVSEDMTDETVGMLASRLATLEEVQGQNAELQRQLEANEEVQRLLG